jgi:hypothetical protein
LFVVGTRKGNKPFLHQEIGASAAKKKELEECNQKHVRPHYKIRGQSKRKVKRPNEQNKHGAPKISLCEAKFAGEPSDA